MVAKKEVSKDLLESINDLILTLHERIIKQSGGTNGVRDNGGLYHSIHKILLYQEEIADDPISLGAFVYEELARRHHFYDGNKRTAHVFAKIMLFLSGYHLKIEYQEAVKFIIEIAKDHSKVSTTEIKRWINKHIILLEGKNREKYLNEAISDIAKYGN